MNEETKYVLYDGDVIKVIHRSDSKDDEFSWKGVNGKRYSEGYVKRNEVEEDYDPNKGIHGSSLAGILSFIISITVTPLLILLLFRGSDIDAGLLATICAVLVSWMILYSIMTCFIENRHYDISPKTLWNKMKKYGLKRISAWIAVLSPIWGFAIKKAYDLLAKWFDWPKFLDFIKDIKDWLVSALGFLAPYLPGATSVISLFTLWTKHSIKKDTDGEYAGLKSNIGLLTGFILSSNFILYMQFLNADVNSYLGIGIVVMNIALTVFSDKVTDILFVKEEKDVKIDSDKGGL